MRYSFDFGHGIGYGKTSTCELLSLHTTLRPSLMPNVPVELNRHWHHRHARKCKGLRSLTSFSQAYVWAISGYSIPLSIPFIVLRLYCFHFISVLVGLVLRPLFKTSVGSVYKFMVNKIFEIQNH